MYIADFNKGKFMTKHILIMGGIWNTDNLIKNVYNWKTTLFITTDQVTSGLESYYDRIVTFSKDAPVEEWLEMAKTIHRLDPIERVGNYGFYFQDKGCAIAKELNLPVFNPEDAVKCADDKLYMREVLRAKNLDSCQSMLIKTIDELKEFARKYQFPIIIKPKDGVASRGIFRINDEKELEQAYDQFRSDYPKFEIIVEQFLVGPEFSIETYSEKGKHRIITITEKFKDDISFVELGHLIPARIPKGQSADVIKQYIKDFLTAINVQTGPAHTEVILTKDGPKLIETQLRLGGDMIPRLMQLATGIDFWDITARQAIGDIAFDLLPDELYYEKSATIIYALPTKKSTFKKFSKVEEAQKLEGIDRIDSLKSIGYEFDGVLESSKRACSVISSGEDASSAIENALSALNYIDLDVSDETNTTDILPKSNQIK